MAEPPASVALPVPPRSGNGGKANGLLPEVREVAATDLTHVGPARMRCGRSGVRKRAMQSLRRGGDEPRAAPEWNTEMHKIRPSELADNRRWRVLGEVRFRASAKAPESLLT